MVIVLPENDTCDVCGWPLTPPSLVGVVVKVLPSKVYENVSLQARIPPTAFRSPPVPFESKYVMELMALDPASGTSCHSPTIASDPPPDDEEQPTATQ